MKPFGFLFTAMAVLAIASFAYSFPTIEDGSEPTIELAVETSNAEEPVQPVETMASDLYNKPDKSDSHDSSDSDCDSDSDSSDDDSDSDSSDDDSDDDSDDCCDDNSDCDSDDDSDDCCDDHSDCDSDDDSDDCDSDESHDDCCETPPCIGFAYWIPCPCAHADDPIHDQ